MKGFTNYLLYESFRTKQLFSTEKEENMSKKINAPVGLIYKIFIDLIKRLWYYYFNVFFKEEFF